MSTPEAALLKSRARQVRAPLAGASALAALGAALLVGQYGLLAGVIADAVFRGSDLAALSPRLEAVAALILARALLGWAAEAVQVAAAGRAKQSLREDLLDHLLALGPVRLADESSGALAALLTEGVEALEAYIARFLPAMTQAALIPLLLLAVVLPLDWISGLVLALTAPLIPLFMILIGQGAERLNQRQWAKLARMSAHFLEALQNLVTLKLFNASRREAELIAAVSEDYRVATMAVLRVAFLSSLALEFFATLSIAMVAVFIGFRLMWGQIAFERGLFILLAVPEFYLPLRQLGAQYHARMQAIGAATHMVALLRREIPAPALPATGGGAVPPTGGGVIPPTGGGAVVEATGLRLVYPDGRVGLDGVDLTLPEGALTALAGPSGAGKSSLVGLLMGFVAPSAGTLRLGGSRAPVVAWVPQRPFLFRGSVADNIRLGAPEADDDAVAAAAERVGADSFIRALDGGYAHFVAEGGGGLSGGQIRLIALARAALLDPTLLILDEPTASLDRAAERAVSAALDRLARGRTVLVVAHRLETLTRADSILVLDRGRVAERGRHADLAAQGGLYAAMLEDGAALAAAEAAP